MPDDLRTLRITLEETISELQSQLGATQSQLAQSQAQLSAAQTQLTQLNAGVTSAAAGQFTYSSQPGAPVVTSISPATGPASGGLTVTISGSGFIGVTAVAFGNTPATSFTFVSDSQITAGCPPGVGSVNVTVTTPLGSSVPLTALQALQATIPASPTLPTQPLQTTP